MSAKKKPTEDDLLREAIAARLADLASGEALKLALVGIGRVLFRHAKNGGDWVELFEERADDVRHVVDWIRASVANGEEWLGRVNDKGLPLKLAKMHSMDQLVREADKAMEKANQKLGREAGRGVAVEMELADGWRVVRLLTVESLDRESAVMQHCIGNGGYDYYLSDPENHAFFSLRDRFDKPHATMHVDVKGGSITQLSGKQNRMPVREYLAALAPFAAAKGFLGGTEKLGFACDARGAPVHLASIPNGTEFEGNLVLPTRFDEDEVAVPKGMRVSGDLTLSQAFSGLLGTDLEIGGSLRSHDLEAIAISPKVKIGGGIHLTRANGVAFPETLHVKGDLVLNYYTGVKLPKHLVVDGTFDISGSDISELPGFLEVGKALIATGSKLARIGAGTRIGGSAFLGSVERLHELPDGLEIGENLLLRDTPIKRAGSGLVVGGIVSVDADRVGVLTIPEDARIEGGIHLRNPETGGSVCSAEEFRMRSAEIATPETSEPPPLRRAAR
jgi:hypothetical protein